MKWLFYTVLFTNICFFAYNIFFVSEPHNKGFELKQSNHQLLVLLSEVDAANQNISKDKVGKDDSADKKSDGANIDAPEQESVGQKSSHTEVSPAETDLQKMPAKESTAKNKDKSVSNKVADAPRKTIASITQKVLPEKKTENSLCYIIGPLKKNDMNDVRTIFEKEYQNQISFGIESTSATTYYRIYIPPLESKEKIKETLSLLSKNRLKDHYVMSINGRKNAIALGVFKQRSAAERVAVRAQKLGLSSTIEAISDDKNSLYNLQINFQQHHQIERFREILDKKKLKSRECENKG